ALGSLVVCGCLLTPARWWPATASADATNWYTLADFGAAMVLIMFGYAGWHLATLVTGEMRDPQRNLSRGLIFGVLGVVVLYIGVNIACVRTLGADLPSTQAPASAVMRLALGDAGARWIALGITISAAGFLSQATLTTPRLYYSMAQDGLFF